jgi:hypothetical protein
MVLLLRADGGPEPSMCSMRVRRRVLAPTSSKDRRKSRVLSVGGLVLPRRPSPLLKPHYQAWQPIAGSPTERDFAQTAPPAAARPRAERANSEAGCRNAGYPAEFSAPSVSSHALLRVRVVTSVIRFPTAW